jgi:hypothetical protein
MQPDFHHSNNTFSQSRDESAPRRTANEAENHLFLAQSTALSTGSIGATAFV